MSIEQSTYVKPTRRCPVARLEDLNAAKEINLQIVAFGKPQSEEDATMLQLLHLKLETALGGVTRPGRGFLQGTLKPATMRPAGAKGWALEVERYREHEERLTGTPETKRRDFVKQFGLEHEPILNNRHEKRAWLCIVRDL
jgi:hypothetical protein